MLTFPVRCFCCPPVCSIHTTRRSTVRYQPFAFPILPGNRSDQTTHLARRWSLTLRTGARRCGAWRLFQICVPRCVASGRLAGLPSQRWTCAPFTIGTLSRVGRRVGAIGGRLLERDKALVSAIAAHLWEGTAAYLQSNWILDGLPRVSGRHQAALRLPFICDMLRYLPPAQRAHIESLELLDEVEEWHLLLEHYALVWGARDPRVTSDDCSIDGVDDLDNAEDPSVRDIAPGQVASPFVAAFMLRPASRQTDAPRGAAGLRQQGRLAADPQHDSRRGHLGGVGDNLFPGAHLAGAD